LLKNRKRSRPSSSAICEKRFLIDLDSLIATNQQVAVKFALPQNFLCNQIVSRMPLEASLNTVRYATASHKEYATDPDIRVIPQNHPTATRRFVDLLCVIVTELNLARQDQQ